MASAEFKRAKYLALRTDPVAFAAYREKQKANYEKRRAADPDFLAKQARRRREKQMTDDELVKHRCRQQTKNAINRGDLVVEPCEVCGDKTVDAHHDDYSDHMNIRWLCRKHHSEHHSQEWLKRNLPPELPSLRSSKELNKRSLMERIYDATEWEPNTGCHFWSGAVDTKGYPRMTFEKKSTAPYRELMKAEMGVKKLVGTVRRICSQPRCMNLEHLFLEPALKSTAAKEGGEA